MMYGRWHFRPGPRPTYSRDVGPWESYAGPPREPGGVTSRGTAARPVTHKRQGVGMRIFGREPAVIIGFIGAVLTALSGHVPNLTAGAAAAITALLAAALTAWATRPWAVAAFVGVLNAGIALVSEYGLHLDAATVTNLTAVLVFGLAIIGIRPQVTPAASP